MNEYSRFLDYKFVKWGEKRHTMIHYKVMYKGKEIAMVLRTGDNRPDFYVLPTAWSKGIKGFRTRTAVVEFLQQFYVDHPWRDEPGTRGYSEYSVDGKTWTRGERPAGKCHMRYVGVTLSIELEAKDNGASDSN